MDVRIVTAISNGLTRNIVVARIEHSALLSHHPMDGQKSATSTRLYRKFMFDTMARYRTMSK
jgi:hypothetical protein